ncbi:MAG TPA: chromosome segregation protein SMC [Candidatus Limnocylindria bacterium]|nr:chromosome segregation protein SMC [Candidatus Limnocylindria bacterium]
MSRLRELRLHGFKSFADQTRFVFEPGVNAVIGPNGSGKSNMADAVRWVLGEQSNRSLRTRRADDVIFAGSESRKPQGMAEAVLTLDNEDGWLPIDFAEVSIGRRAYRSGDSEYLINGARARLRDVVELLGEGRLGANELVVVGQGTVDAALSLRPEERRQLFEEAAGVKGLQVKRNEATVRLAKSLDNLARVSDILGELKPQVRRLALQAEHQQQHDALGARARALVIASHRRREQQARARLGDARRAAAAAEAALAAFRESQEATRTAVQAAEARYWEAEEAARAAAHEREATREALIRAESRLENLEARVRELAGTLAREEKELADAEASAIASPSEARDAIAPALAQAQAAEEAWRMAVARLADADESLLHAEEAVAAVRARQSDRIAAAARLSEEAARHASRVEQLEREAVDLRARSQELADAARRAAAATSAATRRVEEAREALERAAHERDEAQAAADRARQRAVELDERRRALRAELDAIAEPHDAASRLGRRLRAAGWPSLLDAIDAPEASWPAIEAVVGGELEAALVWHDADPSDAVGDARGAVRLLAAAEPGGADRDAALAAVDASRTLAEWAGGSAAPRAFHRTVVARDLAALLDGWRRLPPGWSAVTEHGDLADARGIVVLRGRADPPGGAAARIHARRRELTEAVGRLERETATAQAAAHEATERLRAARDGHLAARDAHDEAERDLRRSHGEEETATAQAERLTTRLSRLSDERAALGPAPAPVDAATGEASAPELAELESAAVRARAERVRLAAERDTARERWTATREAAQEIETRTAGQRQERAVREARVAQLRASIPERRAQLETARAEHEEVRQIAATSREADEAARARHETAERARAEQRRELLELERGAGSAGSRLAELERQAQATAIEASRRDEALGALARERELAMEGLPETDAPLPTDEVDALDDEALETELRRVRRTLAQIGSVNPFAVEEHREMAARLDEMTTQDADLRAAIASTEELIARLDSEITQQFDTAFRAIAEHFDAYCRLLFAGGSGSLQMADEADGDAPGGIEIVVRPPGKRLQRLAMLSGGERALTGVALLFAMLTVNPVPFCILDEVDAALDEANIGRFAQALRRLSESIDFVVITHNRATIEVADTIYGVTMTDAAVSRVLSLRLADLPVEVTA